MKRQQREGDLSTIPLDDLPTEDIEPVNISPDREFVGIDRNARKLYSSLKNWFDEAYRRTKNTGKEHGFYVDIFGNVIGIVEGNEFEVEWPEDIVQARMTLVHTHPTETPVLSPSDIAVFDELNDEGSQCIMAVPQDGRGPGIFHLYKITDLSNTSIRLGSGTGENLVSEYSENATQRIHSSRALDPLEVITRVDVSAEALFELYDFINDLKAEGETLGYSYMPVLRSKIED